MSEVSLSAASVFVTSSGRLLMLSTLSVLASMHYYWSIAKERLRTDKTDYVVKYNGVNIVTQSVQPLSIPLRCKPMCSDKEAYHCWIYFQLIFHKKEMRRHAAVSALSWSAVQALKLTIAVFIANTHICYAFHFTMSVKSDSFNSFLIYKTMALISHKQTAFALASAGGLKHVQVHWVK